MGHIKLPGDLLEVKRLHSGLFRGKEATAVVYCKENKSEENQDSYWTDLNFLTLPRQFRECISLPNEYIYAFENFGTIQ